jgi:polyhydroxyalkanoate synthesis regulator protein
MLLEERGRPLFSNAFLSQLIQCRAVDTGGVLGRYLDECMKMFVANIDKLRELATATAEGAQGAERAQSAGTAESARESADSIAVDIPIPAPRA